MCRHEGINMCRHAGRTCPLQQTTTTAVLLLGCTSSFKSGIQHNTCHLLAQSVVVSRWCTRNKNALATCMHQLFRRYLLLIDEKAVMGALTGGCIDPAAHISLALLTSLCRRPAATFMLPSYHQILSAAAHISA